MLYDYRNIDTDIKLLKFARRFHSEDELTLDQLKYLASQDGYSEREIDLAVNDYYLVYVRPEEIVWNYILPISGSVMILMMLLRIIFG